MFVAEEFCGAAFDDKVWRIGGIAERPIPVSSAAIGFSIQYPLLYALEELRLRRLFAELSTHGGDMEVILLSKVLLVVRGECVGDEGV